MAETKPTPKFDYTDKPIPDAIHEALGSASVCWDKEGVFDVETALAIGKALEARVDLAQQRAYRTGYDVGRLLRPRRWWWPW